MIHRLLGGASGQARILKYANEIIRIKQELTEIYVKHNSKGKTFDDFESAMDRDNFMNAKEALEFGLIDEIVDKRTSNTDKYRMEVKKVQPRYLIQPT